MRQRCLPLIPPRLSADTRCAAPRLAGGVVRGTWAWKSRGWGSIPIMLRQCARACYAMSGTEVRNAGTRCAEQYASIAIEGLTGTFPRGTDTAVI
eukprot:1564706-Rhodomonas_salina.2